MYRTVDQQGNCLCTFQLKEQVHDIFLLTQYINLLQHLRGTSVHLVPLVYVLFAESILCSFWPIQCESYHRPVETVCQSWRSCRDYAKSLDTQYQYLSCDLRTSLVVSFGPAFLLCFFAFFKIALLICFFCFRIQ